MSTTTIFLAILILGILWLDIYFRFTGREPHGEEVSNLSVSLKESRRLDIFSFFIGDPPLPFGCFGRCCDQIVRLGLGRLTWV